MLESTAYSPAYNRNLTRILNVWRKIPTLAAATVCLAGFVSIAQLQNWAVIRCEYRRFADTYNCIKTAFHDTDIIADILAIDGQVVGEDVGVGVTSVGKTSAPHLMNELHWRLSMRRDGWLKTICVFSLAATFHVHTFSKCLQDFAYRITK